MDLTQDVAPDSWEWAEQVFFRDHKKVTQITGLRGWDTWGFYRHRWLIIRGHVGNRIRSMRRAAWQQAVDAGENLLREEPKEGE